MTRRMNLAAWSAAALSAPWWLGASAQVSKQPPVAVNQQSGAPTAPAAPAAKGQQPPAQSSPSAAIPQRPNFDVYWCVTGTNAAAVSPAGLPVRTDIIILYDHLFGRYPATYPDRVQYEGIPQAVNMAQHLAKVRTDLARMVPDVNFSGVVVIDYENWAPDWTLINPEMTRACIQYTRQRNPGRTQAQIEAIAQAEFDEASRRFMLETIRLCKQLRPNAKWGYYAYPDTWRADRFRAMRWLWDASDVIMPSIYAINRSVTSGAARAGEAPAQQYVNAVTDLIRLSREVGGPNKPVLAFIWFRYHQVNKQFGLQMLNDTDLRTMIRVPREAGADGLILWDHLDERAYVPTFRDFVTGKAAPELRLVSRPSPDSPLLRAPAAGVGGSRR